MEYDVGSWDLSSVCGVNLKYGFGWRSLRYNSGFLFCLDVRAGLGKRRVCRVHGWDGRCIVTCTNAIAVGA